MIKKFVLRDEEGLPFSSVLDNVSTVLTTSSSDVKNLWGTYVSDLSEIITANVPKVEVVTHSLTELEVAKRQLVHNKHIPIVAVDSYALGSIAAKLGVSRHFKPGGSELIGVAERPGYAPVEQQLQTIKDILGVDEINVFEDDTYTGETSRKLIKALDDADLPVAQFITGIQVAHETADSRIIAVHTYDPSEIHELTDPRDYLLGAYEGGLVIKIGQTIGRAPYVLPLVDVKQRASVDSRYASKFSKAVLALNGEVFGSLEEMIDQPILVSHGHQSFVDYMATQLDPVELKDMRMVDLCSNLASSLN